MNHNEYDTGLTGEMLNAYMDVSSQDTPDLWSRIEEGFDKELATMKEEQVSNDNIIQFQKKRTMRRVITSIAALIVICLIALPVIHRRSAKSSEKDNASKIVALKADESVDEGCTSANGSDQMEVAETDSACCEDTQENPVNAGTQNMETIFSDFKISGYICMDASGNAYLYVQAVVSEEVSAINLEEGNIILLKNSDSAVAGYCEQTSAIDGVPDGLLLDNVTCYGPFEMFVTVEQGDEGLPQYADYFGILHVIQSISK